MYRNKKLIVTLVVIMIINMMSFTFAQSDLTDISNTWGKDYIENVVGEDIMAVYDDNTFKPKENSTKLEVLVGIYKTLESKDKLNIENVTGLVEEYKDLMEAADIPVMLAPYGGEDVYPAVAFSLDRNIISNEDLKAFVKNGDLTEVSKIDTSVYVGKALNLLKKEDLNKIIDLDYTDAFEIPYEAAPYVDLLINYGIVSSKGDSTGRYNPESKVTREILSVFLSNFIKAVDSETVIEVDGVNKKSSGTLSAVYEDMDVIEIKENDGSIEVYDIEDPDVFLNDNKITLSNLEIGQNIEYVVENSEVTKIYVDEKYDSLEGTFDNVSKVFTTPTGEEYRVLSMNKSTGIKGFYKLLDSTFISLDGEEADFEDLTSGDKLFVEYEGNVLKSVKAFSESSELAGILRRPLDSQKVLSVLLDNGNIFVRDIDFTDSSISRGDIVRVELKYGEVVDVESTGQSSVEEGYIREIIISDNPKLTLEIDGSLKTFKLNDDYSIKNDDLSRNLDIYDLRLDNYCKINLNGIGINEIVMKEPVEKTKFKAVVTEVHSTSNILKVEDDNGQEVVVGVKDNSSLSVSNYIVGDTLYIYGVKLSNDLFEAEKIIIIE